MSIEEFRALLVAKREAASNLNKQYQILREKDQEIQKEIATLAVEILLQEKWLSKIRWILKYTTYGGFHLETNFDDPETEHLDLMEHFEFFDLLENAGVDRSRKIELAQGITLSRFSELKITWKDPVVAINFFQLHNFQIDCSQVMAEISSLKNKLDTFESFMANFNREKSNE